MNDNTPALFFSRFRGLQRGHGETRVLDFVEANGKRGSSSGTVHEPLTISLVKQHLDGEIGVGMCPLMDDGTVCFGAIDIDKYDKSFDLFLFAELIASYQLPLILCRTKSGGAHLYCFAKEPIKAEVMRGKLMDWATSLGYSGVEVYPKQTRFASEQDFGNWINLPYQNADETDRYAILPSKVELLSVDDFLVHADRMAVTEEQIITIEAPVNEKYKDAFEDGPPCLQSLAIHGFERGSRNNAMFDIGVLLRKKFGDSWADHMDEMNQRFMDPPLGHKEIMSITKSLGKKDGYFYRCNESPICSACNKQICLTRKYGVGDSTNDPGVAIGELEMMETEPPIWFVAVNGKRIALTTSELKDQMRFSTRCMEQLQIWPKAVKPQAWAQIVREKLEKVTVIPVPPEAKLAGQVYAYLERYLVDRPHARTKNEIMGNKPWYDTEKNQTHFRGPHFAQYLEQQRLRVPPARLWEILREFGVAHGQHQIKGKCIQVWIIKSFIKPETDAVIPKLVGDV